MRHVLPRILILLLLLIPAAAEAETEYRASVGIAEEYNTNVNEEPDGEEDFVTRVRPGLGVSYAQSRLQLMADYWGSYNHYAHGNRENEFVHDLEAHGLLEAVENVFFVRVEEKLEQVNRDVTRGEAVEEDSTAVQETRNSVSVSPYFAIPLGRRGTVNTGYQLSHTSFMDTDQWNTEHRFFGDGEYELTPRLHALAGYFYSRVFKSGEGYGRHVAYGGGRYYYTEDSSVYLTLGPSYTQYSGGEDAPRLFWHGGVEHVFTTLRVALETSLDYEVDPVSEEPAVRKWAELSVGKEFSRSTVDAYARHEIYEDDFTDGETTLEVLGLRAAHWLTDRLQARADGRVQWQDQDGQDARFWYAGAGLVYALAEDLDAEFWYRLKVVTGDLDEDNYNVNRVWLQLTKTF